MAEPTLFSFPSRHHPLPPLSNGTYVASFLSPSGLHPTLRLTFPSFLPPPIPYCALHAYFIFPSYIFPDKYQLSSSNLLAAKNLYSIRSLAGETDLEAPDWTIKQWGSSMLMELAPPPRSHGSRNEAWSAYVPLHLRYLQPEAGGRGTMELPWPVVFWACPAQEGTKMSANPFDRLNLGFEGLFGPRTMFYHLTPHTNSETQNLIERLQIPVLDAEKLANAETGTVVVVMLGTIWLVAKLVWMLSKGTTCSYKSTGTRLSEEKAKSL